MPLHETLNEEESKVLARLLIDITVRKVCPPNDPDAKVRLMSYIAGIVTSAPNRTTDNLNRLTQAFNDESTAIAREYSETQGGNSAPTKDTITKVIAHLAESIGDPEVDKIADWWDIQEQTCRAEIIALYKAGNR